MSGENNGIRDVSLREATTAEIASALREQGRKRFGDKPLFHAGPESYTAERLAQEIEQGTKIGREYLEVIRRSGGRLSDFFRIPTKEEQGRARQIIRARMKSSALPRPNVRVILSHGTPNDGTLGECEFRPEIIVGGVMFFHHRPGTPFGYMPEEEAREFAQRVAANLGVPLEEGPR